MLLAKAAVAEMDVEPLFSTTRGGPTVKTMAVRVGRCVRVSRNPPRRRTSDRSLAGPILSPPRGRIPVDPGKSR